MQNPLLVRGPCVPLTATERANQIPKGKFLAFLDISYRRRTDPVIFVRPSEQIRCATLFLRNSTLDAEFVWSMVVSSEFIAIAGRLSSPGQRYDRLPHFIFSSV